MQRSAATASHARGELERAAGSAAEAVARLQTALRLWQSLEAPYESARARASLAAAYLANGDRESGVLELRAASATFERLSALPDLELARARLADVNA